MRRGCVKFVRDNVSCVRKNDVPNVVLKSCPVEGTGLIWCRGEEGDPICMVCLAEMSNDNDRGQDDDETEMAHNGH